jgi:hypothetical protein
VESEPAFLALTVGHGFDQSLPHRLDIDSRVALLIPVPTYAGEPAWNRFVKSKGSTDRGPILYSPSR